MADWDEPTVTTDYDIVFTITNEKFEDCAKMFDGSTSTNIPTGAYKINGAGANELQKWSGSSWALQNLTLGDITSAKISYASDQAPAGFWAETTGGQWKSGLALSSDSGGISHTTLYAPADNSGAIEKFIEYSAEKLMLYTGDEDLALTLDDQGAIFEKQVYAGRVSFSADQGPEGYWLGNITNWKAGLAIESNNTGSPALALYTAGDNVGGIKKVWRCISDSQKFFSGNEALAFTIEDDQDVTFTQDIVMAASKTVDGRDLSVDGAKLDGLISGSVSSSTGTGTVSGNSGWAYGWSGGTCTITHNLGTTSYVLIPTPHTTIDVNTTSTNNTNEVGIKLFNVTSGDAPKPFSFIFMLI